uniref:Uncharacterized protein n=1 Tax=Rhizophora mucronata TaxID=61149 RepID=A0A2P2J1H8_RHIMU
MPSLDLFLTLNTLIFLLRVLPIELSYQTSTASYPVDA